MSALKGIEGIIQTEGFFWDTEKGIVPESKQHDVACPVIVMEMMEGVCDIDWYYSCFVYVFHGKMCFLVIRENYLIECMH